MQSVRPRSQNNGGYALMLMMIILTAVALSVMTSLNSVSTNRAKDTSSERLSFVARAAADGCAELGIEQVILSSAYTGSGSATFSRGSCTYTVTTVSGTNAQISAVGTAGDTTRKTQVVAVRSPFSFVSWLEVP